MGMVWAEAGGDRPHLLTAQLALIFSLGAVPVEVTGLPELEDCPIPAGEGTLQGHLGSWGSSWRHIETHAPGQFGWSHRKVQGEHHSVLLFTSQGLMETPASQSGHSQGQHQGAERKSKP